MKSLELFSGAGGMALGVHQAGYQLISAVDFDEAAIETCRSNQIGNAVPPPLAKAIAQTLLR